MKHVAILERAVLLPTLLWLFLTWYIIEKPWHILRGYLDYAKAIGEIFSFVFLLRTFLSPWKNIVGEYPTKGLDVVLIFEAFTLNCISRIIGMIFRTVALAIGLALEILVLAIAIVTFLFWVTYPAFLMGGIIFLLRSLA